MELAPVSTLFSIKDTQPPLEVPFVDQYYYHDEDKIDEDIKEIFLCLKGPLEALKASLSNDTVNLNSASTKVVNGESNNNFSNLNSISVEDSEEKKNQLDDKSRGKDAIRRKIDSYFLFHIIDFLLYLINESLHLLGNDNNLKLNSFFNTADEEKGMSREFSERFCSKSVKKRIILENLFEEGRKELFRILNIGYCTNLSIQKPRYNSIEYLDIIKSICYGNQMTELERLDLDTTLEILYTRSQAVELTDGNIILEDQNNKKKEKTDESKENHGAMRRNYLEHTLLPPSLTLPSAHLYNYRE